MSPRMLSRAAAVIGAAALAVLGLGAPSALATTGPTITPVVSGLNAPRGIAFDGQGDLYVSESGQWVPSGPTLTSTGKVDKFSGTTFAKLWSTGFQSVASSENGPEVIGPEGISALGKGCMKNSAGQRNGCQVQMITSASTAELAHGGLAGATQAGRLFRLNGATGAPTELANVGDQNYAWGAAHSSLNPDLPDSNPYGVLVTKDAATDQIRTFVADAGTNTIDEVLKDGTIRVIAYIPNDPVRDSTPTCVAMGPDGMLYVGTLDLVFNLFVPGGPGRSTVYRVDPNASFPTVPTVWAHGLTTVSSCTFDTKGTFWATEMFAPAPAGPPGDVVAIPFSSPTSMTHYGLGQLPLPGGIAQGPDGSMYVSVGSADPTPNAGKVVRLTR